MGKKTSFIILISIFLISCSDDYEEKSLKLPKTTFKDYEEKYYRVEGGYSNDTKDNASYGVSGIHTNKGLTWKVYKKYSKKILGKKPSKKIFLKLSNYEISLFIKHLYWNKFKADSIKDQNKANILVDTYVNMGNISFILLEKTLKKDLNVDIKIKKQIITNEIIDLINEDDLFYETFKSLRIEKYHDISKGKNKIYIKGWLNRIKKMEQ